ncbi:MAG: GNAT family N-acetyltransferase [Candidatus Dormibacteria bacterium]
MSPSEQAVTHIHRLLDQHWTAVLRVDPEVWRDTDVVVASHPEPTHADHVYVIRRQDSAVFIVPQALVGSTSAAVGAWPTADVCDASFLRSLYGDHVVAVNGPYWLGYATSGSFRPVDSRGARPLSSAADRVALDELRAAVADHEALDAGLGVQARREYGIFDAADGSLTSAGTLTPFLGKAANVGVLTHPRHRGEGFGTAMVSALTAVALAGGATAVQFRLMHEDRAAQRIARVLGFVEDAVTFEVQLRGVDTSESFPVRVPPISG